MTTDDSYDPYPPSRSVSAHDASSDSASAAMPRTSRPYQYYHATPQGPGAPEDHPAAHGPGQDMAPHQQVSPYRPGAPYPPGTPYPTPVYGGYLYARPDEMNWAGITSLALGLAGIVAWWATAIPGIILGVIGLVAARNGRAINRGMALAGLIISILITLAPIVIWFLFIFVLVATSP